MAKRKGFKKARTMVRYVKSKGRRRGGSSSGFKGMFNRLPILPFGYGLVRTPIANAITPVTNKLPFGEYNDEIALGVIAFFVAKQKGIFGQIGSKVLDIEGYRAGELTSSKVITGTGAVSGTRDYVY